MDKQIPRVSTIELFKESMKFSAAHFTIFSSESRENLHGHNYQVYAAFDTDVGDEGLAFDYRIYKEKLLSICEQLNEKTLIAGLSKHLSITDQGDYYHVTFSHETMMFLKRDMLVLPITNATVEELSNWILNELLANLASLNQHKISKIVIKVSSGPGRTGSSSWEK